MRTYLILFLCVSCCVFHASAQVKETSNRILVEMQEGKTTTIIPLLSEQMRASVTEAQLSSIWGALQKQMGDFIEVTGESEQKVAVGVSYSQILRFKNATLNFILNYDEAGQIIGFFFRPTQQMAKVAFKQADYDLSENYTERKIMVTTGDYKLPGLLTLPKGLTNVPVVILVHGSGPNDMDETIGPNRVFADLAAGLAQQGIATIRYEKRTKTYGAQLAKDTTMTLDQEVTEDAISAVKLAAAQVEIDPQQIFVLGHSLGGMTAPRIGQYAGVKGIIIAAGNARPLEDVLIDQYDLLTDGLAEREDIMTNIKTEVNNVKKLKPTIYIPTDQLPLGMPQAYWLFLNEYDQVATAKKLKKPILVLQGEDDYQVTMKDFDLWKKALPKATFKSYPEMNHLLMKSDGKIGNEAYKTAGNVEKVLIDDVANWIKSLKASK
ncbi:alpha/beta fold hydrolase [Penaeicola halotolerans]|uniref:alpha/beta fold hydrolase n=1 Tax=Penaeicola halotolerans TaxID=2793196 RepID=UPI001CF874CA|nr:alpha/beta fold hydrolase [Penaeicola halotolerans]